MNDYGENECRELLAAYYAGGPPRVSRHRARQDRPDGAARGILLARLGELRVAAAEAIRVLAAALDERPQLVVA
jgi:soluble lytic murein transglycosylase-like protein